MFFSSLYGVCIEWLQEIYVHVINSLNLVADIARYRFISNTG